MENKQMEIDNTGKISDHKLYKVLNGIKSRCYNPNHKSYPDYGGRGIKVCDEWKKSYKSFIDWGMSHGYKEGLTIERINNDDDYSPENCTFIPKSEQVNNRRNNLVYTYNGKTQNLSQWCRELNLDYKRTNNRITAKHWPFERAITEPVNVEKRNRSIREKCQYTLTTQSRS